MKNSTAIRWKLVHHIFTTAGIRAGNSLHLGDLMTAWSGAGRCQESLAETLQGLVRLGHLWLKDTPNGPMVRLVNAGFGPSSPRLETESTASTCRTDEGRWLQYRAQALAAGA